MRDLNLLADTVAAVIDLIPRGVRKLTPIVLDKLRIAVRRPRSFKLRPAERTAFRLKNGYKRGRFYSPADLRRDRRGRWRRPDGTYASRAEISARRRLELEARRGPGGRFVSREEAYPLEGYREASVWVRFKGVIPEELVREAVATDLAVSAAARTGPVRAFHLSARVSNEDLAAWFQDNGWEVEEEEYSDPSREEAARAPGDTPEQEGEPYLVVRYGRWFAL